MVDASTLSAVNAYKNQLKMLQNAKAGGMPEDAVPQASFMDLVKGAAVEAVDTQYKAEALQMDSLTGGNVDLTDLVTAISSAELTLNTVVAVRDRVINAYQEIIRMPI